MTGSERTLEGDFFWQKCGCEYSLGLFCCTILYLWASTPFKVHNKSRLNLYKWHLIMKHRYVYGYVVCFTSLHTYTHHLREVQCLCIDSTGNNLTCVILRKDCLSCKLENKNLNIQLLFFSAILKIFWTFNNAMLKKVIYIFEHIFCKAFDCEINVTVCYSFNSFINK